MVRTRMSLILSLSLFINENTETNKIIPKLYSIISCSCIQAIVCFEHSNSFQSKRGKSYAQSLKGTAHTSFLSATTLIYAIGAGITTDAGTRLALQFILVEGFTLNSIQLRDLLKTSYHYFMSLPPHVGIG